MAPSPSHVPRTRSPLRYAKFLIVGLLNAAVDLGVLNLLMVLHPTRMPWQLTVYNTVAVACAVLNSYIWNRWWTFRSEARGGRREFLAYLAQALLNVAVNDAVLTAADVWLTAIRGLPVFWAGNLAKGVAMMVSSTVTYLCLRWWVFRRPVRAWV